MSNMALFEERQVRRIFHNDEWWFVLVDIVSALTDSVNPSEYLKKLRRRDPALGEALRGEGGDKLSPPWAASSDSRRCAAAAMLERPGHPAAHPVRSVAAR